MVHTKVHHKVSQKSTGRKITGIKTGDHKKRKWSETAWGFFTNISSVEYWFTVWSNHCCAGFQYKGLVFLWHFNIRSISFQKLIWSLSCRFFSSWRYSLTDIYLAFFFSLFCMFISKCVSQPATRERFFFHVKDFSCSDAVSPTEMHSNLPSLLPNSHHLFLSLAP